MPCLRAGSLNCNPLHDRASSLLTAATQLACQERSGRLMSQCSKFTTSEPNAELHVQFKSHVSHPLRIRWQLAQVTCSVFFGWLQDAAALTEDGVIYKTNPGTQSPATTGKNQQHAPATAETPAKTRPHAGAQHKHAPATTAKYKHAPCHNSKTKTCNPPSPHTFPAAAAKQHGLNPPFPPQRQKTKQKNRGQAAVKNTHPTPTMV